MTKTRRGSRQVTIAYVEKLKALQPLADASFFRRNRITMSVESLEAFGYGMHTRQKGRA